MFKLGNGRLVYGAALALASAVYAGSLSSAVSPQAGGRTAGPALGRPAALASITAMDLTVQADGTGLPRGSGTVAQGLATYAAKCEACHGAAGSGGIADRLTGGIGSLAAKKPVRTVASYWPYAPTLFDYVRRAMPYNASQSLSDNEVYGVVAYLLSIDHIVPFNGRLDAKSLAKVKMPNRNGFLSLKSRDFDGNIERAASDR
jgi:mono/diheme cytochrome c family protein